MISGIITIKIFAWLALWFGRSFSDFGASARVKMNELCAAFNLPGKIGVDGSKVTKCDDGNLRELEIIVKLMF